jgi:hypothetical protein
MPQGVPAQHRPVPAKFRLYVYTGHAAPSSRFSVNDERRKYQDDDANSPTIGLQEVTVFWEPGWCRMPRETPQASHPEVASAMLRAKKTTREQGRDVVEVGNADLTNADARGSEGHRGLSPAHAGSASGGPRHRRIGRPSIRWAASPSLFARELANARSSKPDLCFADPLRQSYGRRARNGSSPPLSRLMQGGGHVGHGGAMQIAHLGSVVSARTMHGHAIVPHNEIIGLPPVDVDELALGRMLCQIS